MNTPKLFQFWPRMSQANWANQHTLSTHSIPQALSEGPLSLSCLLHHWQCSWQLRKRCACSQGFSPLSSQNTQCSVQGSNELALRRLWMNATTTNEAMCFKEVRELMIFCKQTDNKKSQPSILQSCLLLLVSLIYRGGHARIMNDAEWWSLRSN